MSELDEYHQNLMADIRREADASGILMVEAFFDRMTERLTEAGELEVADRAYYQSGEGGQKLRIDGFRFLHPGCNHFRVAKVGIVHFCLEKVGSI